VANATRASDIAAIVRACTQINDPLICRAAGTSLAGQCVGSGTVLDLGQHLVNILAIDPEQLIARVQPGVVLADLNDQLKTFGLVFPPDPSTATRCQIGGMIGNNAWGAHAPYYGTTRDWVIAIEAVLSDGSRTSFGPCSAHLARSKTESDTLEGSIHRHLSSLLTQHRDAILERYPSARGIPNNAGYPLDVLAFQQPWCVDGPPLNLAPFLCGSEGTLAIVTEATLKLAALPKSKRLVCAHFHSMQEALTAVSLLSKAMPAAIELLDDTILSLTTHNRLQSRQRFWIEGTPKAVLLIEFYGNHNAIVTEQCATVTTDLRAAGLGYTFPQFVGRELDQVWDLRRAGLGLLMGLPPERQAVTGIEDTAVALPDLVPYAQDIQALVQRFGTDCVMYGSVSMGLIHFRPYFDLRQPEQRERYADLMLAVAERVQHYRGSCSAKHGDGRLRAHLLKYTLGEELVELLRGVKGVFDPKGILNPGKIFDAPDILTDLRVVTDRSAPLLAPGLDWSNDGGFLRAASRCHGAGACLQAAGRGTMCPSFQATRDELHSPRGRANMLLAALLGHADISLQGAEMETAMSLCLACKACKSECPANVDIARLKAEIQHQRHGQHGIPLSTQILARFELYCAVASHVPRLANRLLTAQAVKRSLDLHPERKLPRFAPYRFSTWFKTRPRSAIRQERGPVLLLLDTFVEYFEPRIGQCAVELLESFGFAVQITTPLSSGRLAISLGLLDLARAKVRILLQQVRGLVGPEVSVLGLEPSEILTLRDEVPDLTPQGSQREFAVRLAQRSYTLEEFLLKHCGPSLSQVISSTNRQRKAVVHVHCHEQALLGTETSTAAFKLIPTLQTEILKTGCCGMAGFFGYKASNYALSNQIGELSLGPALRAVDKDTVVVANGASCRQQIRHLSGIKAMHSAELLHAMCAGA
jgi:FAD/FMN-containing dehydrogenase/Fe-S oxidoreductase